MGTWIEIGKTGTWTAKNGNKVTLTRDDFDYLAEHYDPKHREAPLVFGHPEDNEPAFGWAQKLKRSGDILLGLFDKVAEPVKQLVRSGNYKKVSMSLTPDKKELRHVGLLGAVQPAIPGLADVKFEDGDDGVTIEFSNHTKPKEEDVEKEELEKKLAEETAAREKAEADAKAARKTAEAAEKELSASKQEALEASLETRINDLVGKKIQAKDKDVMKRLALSLGKTGEEIELSSGAGKKSMEEHLFDFLAGLPDLGLLNEFSDPGAGGEDEGTATDTTKMMSRV